MSEAPLIHAACVALLFAALPAWADRSRLGDDAEVVEAGDCALELATERQREQGEPRRRRTHTVELNCGVGWQSEALLSRATQRQGSERESAWGVELKTALVPRRGSAVGWSLIASARREQAVGQRSRWTEAGVAVEAAVRPAGVWRLEARLGTRRDRIDRRDRTPWEIAVEHALVERWELRAQLGGDDGQPPQWQASLRWAIWPEHAFVTASHGGSSAIGRPRQWALAATWEF